MDISEEGKVSLANFARGACIERFDDEFKRVLDNILDPNTADGPRSVTLKVTISPNEERTSAGVSIHVDSSVRGPKAVPTMIFIGKDRGVSIAFEHNPEQLKLKLTNKTPVVALAGEKEE
ncbi:MAG: hypothetical protein WCV62_05885 [Candidatus Peribacteraceae bacterium]